MARAGGVCGVEAGERGVDLGGVGDAVVFVCGGVCERGV